MNLEKWDKRFIDMAFHIAQWSKDPSSKVGCVIAKGKKFISLGYNGPPAGVVDSPMTREVKYMRTIHAETNAILTSDRKLKNCTLYVTHPPCAQCCAKIIQTGIKRVVCTEPTDDFMSRWASDVQESQLMFSEAGVEFSYFKEQ